MKYASFVLLPLIFVWGFVQHPSQPASATPVSTAPEMNSGDSRSTGTSWYSMHFPDEDYTRPVRDSVFRKGVFEKVPEGIKVYASSYRNGGWLMSRQKQDFAGKEIYLKWKADARFNFADLHAALYPHIRPDASFYQSWQYLSYLSTRNEWDGSVRIPYDVQWYYTRVVIRKDKTATGYTARNNYDNNGGELIQEYQIKLKTTTGYFGMGFGDVYGGKEAWFILGESAVKKTRIARK